jgi:antitoxin component YwqK of YwqJK toxin-antitoxin module
MSSKLIPLAILLLWTTCATAQQTTRYYNIDRKESDAKHARFVSINERTDSGWHRRDYYFEKSLSPEMDGWYEDSTEKIRTGIFNWFYPDKKLSISGRYLQGKKQGAWLKYHPNGMVADSTQYEAGNPIGTSFSWYPNGTPSDSSLYHADGSGTEVTWFDNGNPSSAGVYAAGRLMQGEWKFYHKNGQVSAIELYNQGTLVQKDYYDENGNQVTDTSNRERTATLRGDLTGQTWLRYLQKNLEFPRNYKITNSDEAAVGVTFTIDEDGNVKDAFVSTPFFLPFEREALRVIIRSPKWRPAINHNRYVRSTHIQSVVFNQTQEL